MKTEIIKPQDFGIETKQAKELMSNLPQIKEEREVLEKQYNDVIKLDIESPDSWKKARELRLLIQKNRTQGINTWHRNAKDYFLKGGQFVDAIKRKESSVNERMEAQLLEIEKYEEIQKKKEIERLNTERSAEMEMYSDFVPFGINLGEMEEEEYRKLFKGAKLQYEAEQNRVKEEEEKRLEKERIEKLHDERKDLLLDVWQFVKLKQANFGEMSDKYFDQILVDAESSKADHDKEQERIIKENEILKKEEERKEKMRSKRSKELRPYIIFIRDYPSFINLDEKKYQKGLKEIKEAAKLHREQEEIAKIKAKKEREEKLAFQAKIKAKEEAEQKIAQKELNKNDSEKVKDLISDLENLKDKYTFKSKKNIKMYEDVSVLIQKVINHINK